MSQLDEDWAAVGAICADPGLDGIPEAAHRAMRDGDETAARLHLGDAVDLFVKHWDARSGARRITDEERTTRREYLVETMLERIRGDIASGRWEDDE